MKTGGRFRISQTSSWRPGGILMIIEGAKELIEFKWHLMNLSPQKHGIISFFEVFITGRGVVC